MVQSSRSLSGILGIGIPFLISISMQSLLVAQSNSSRGRNVSLALAPFSINNRRISLRPFSVAIARTVQPSFVQALTLAPFSINNFAMSPFPL